MRKCLAVLVLALLLPAACGPLPRPFQPDDKIGDPNALILPGADAGVTVVPVLGTPPEIGRQLSRLVAQGLRNLEIPASTTTAHPGSYVLQGEAKVQPAGSAEDQVDLTWRLIDPNGLSAGTVLQRERMPRLAWQLPDSPAIAGLAQRATPKLERLIHGDPPTGPEQGPPRVFIALIAGAPGDGAKTLREAFGTILARHRVEVVDAADPDAYTVHCTVKLQDQGSRQQVQIDWQVVSPDGSELGRVGQRNAVPRGALDGPWGEVAYAAAEGGADGVLQILRGAPAPAATKPLR